MIFTLKTFTVSLESMIYFSILIWKHLYTEIWFAQDFIPLEMFYYSAVLDDYHQTRSFCDVLESLQHTHRVRQKTPQDLLEFSQSTFTFITQSLVKNI